MRQSLKELNQMFDPDIRSTSFARYGEAGRQLKTLENHYGDISAIQLRDGVPEGIRDEFDTVRNLYLYSWYVYDFTIPAVLYTRTLIEKGIKEKCHRSAVSLKKVRGLRDLLRLSIDQGWLLNSDFRFAIEMTRLEIVPGANDSEPPTLRSTARYGPDAKDYCEHLAEFLPKLRNTGAHGEAGLGFPASALHEIEVCACIINALFRTADDVPAG